MLIEQVSPAGDVVLGTLRRSSRSEGELLDAAPEELPVGEQGAAREIPSRTGELRLHLIAVSRVFRAVSGCSARLSRSPCLVALFHGRRKLRVVSQPRARRSAPPHSDGRTVLADGGIPDGHEG